MQSVRRGLARWYPVPSALYTALSTRPVVLFVQDFTIDGPRSPLNGLLRRLEDHPVHVYYNTSWHVDEATVLPKHLARLRALEPVHTRLSVTVLAQTPTEHALLAAHGVDALFCSQNALADERVFRPLDDVAKVHDAIYDARLDRFKRHRLAKNVASLALVTYLNADTDRRYAAKVAAEFRGATWFNGFPSPDVRLLSAEEVNRAYAACRVGLCLSAREGAMWASAQYLLAGLPVVSTASEGGRDVFFHPEHVRIVDPDPDAVAVAVSSLAALRLDSAAIRRRTLDAMNEHRRRLSEHVQGILAAAGELRRFEDSWPHVFRHRMVDVTLVGRSMRAEIARHDDAILTAVARGDPWPGAALDAARS